MGLARLLLGLILAVLGFLVLFASWAVNAGATAQAIPPAEAVGLTPHALTSERLSVEWYAAAGTTHVYLTTATPQCPTPSHLVFAGNGSFGSFNATLSPGVTYYLYGCDATSFKQINVLYTLNGGLTVADLLGGATFGVGLLVLALGVRRGRSVEEAETPSTPAEPTDEYAAPPIPPPARKPRTIAAVLSRSIRGSRGVLIRRAQPSAELRGHVMQSCLGCGRVYPPGRYTTCPACGDRFDGAVPPAV